MGRQFLKMKYKQTGVDYTDKFIQENLLFYNLGSTMVSSVMSTNLRPNREEVITITAQQVTRETHL